MIAFAQVPVEVNARPRMMMFSFWVPDGPGLKKRARLMAKITALLYAASDR